MAAKVARHMNERIEKELYEAPREQRRCRGLAGSSPLAPTSSMSLASRRLANSPSFVEHDGLDAGALADEPEQPRFVAARIRLDEKTCVDQRGQVQLELLTADDSTDNHRRFLSI